MKAPRPAPGSQSAAVRSPAAEDQRVHSHASPHDQPVMPVLQRHPFRTSGMVMSSVMPTCLPDTPPAKRATRAFPTCAQRCEAAPIKGVAPTGRY